MILIGATLIFGLSIILLMITDVVHIRSISLEKRHDKILYRFCRVRDEIALAALEEDCDQDSELFEFFYLVNARLIHFNRDAGLCFRDLVRSVMGEISSLPDDEETALMEEIDEANERVKMIVAKWDDAFRYAVLSCAHLVILDRFSERFRIGSERILRVSLKLLKDKDSEAFEFMSHLRHHLDLDVPRSDTGLLA